jgi:hypothetical protein
LAGECSGSSLWANIGNYYILLDWAYHLPAAMADIDTCYILLDWAYHLPAATPLAYQLLSGAVVGFACRR